MAIGKLFHIIHLTGDLPSGHRSLRSTAVDVSDEDAVSGAIEAAVIELGPLAGVATCAGVFVGGDFAPIADVELAQFHVRDRLARLGTLVRA